MTQPRSRISSVASPSCLGAHRGGWDSTHPARAHATRDADVYPRAPELDHVLIAVADVAAAARELEARHGLTSIKGGRHPGYGTANRIVPLGDSYLELVTVADESEAAESVRELGRTCAT